MKGGKVVLAELQDSCIRFGNPVGSLRNFAHQDSGNQKDSTRLNLNGDSAFPVNAFARPTCDTPHQVREQPAAA
jgi:hypothetical protein